MTTSPLSNEQLQERVKSVPYWNQKVQLPGGIVTPGNWPINAPSHRLPESLLGKRVLNAGGADGYWSFDALRRGAKEVVAIDDFSSVPAAAKSAHRDWAGFDLCRETLGYSDDQCKRMTMSVYDVTEAALGRFDVVLFFGVLYQCRHPLLALDKLSSVCDDEIFVETAIADDFSPYRGGFDKGYQKEMVMEFYPGKEYGNDESNWWAPTLLCLGHMVHIAGFPTTQVWKLIDGKPNHLALCRGFAHGQKKRGALD